MNPTDSYHCDEAKKITGRYPPGTGCDVFVNPIHPEKSVLNGDVGVDDLALEIAMVGVGGVGLLLALSYLFLS